jgi:hypothetical protein
LAAESKEGYTFFSVRWIWATDEDGGGDSVEGAGDGEDSIPSG